jgi:hypothetical protein
LTFASPDSINGHRVFDPRLDEPPIPGNPETSAMFARPEKDAKKVSAAKVPFTTPWRTSVWQLFVVSLSH